jgi:hypothetical protein
MPFPITKPLLACLGVVMLWFSPWWMSGKNLAPLDITHEMMEPWRAGNEEITAKNHIVSDSVTQYLIYRMIAAEDYRREGWVGWSSLTYGGTAQHANTMALYGDWSMQLHRWFDFWTAWHLGLMAQVMLAAVGMLLWLRGRGVAAGWAVCGALLFAANSQFVTWINHRWALGAFCWVPWILWSIDTHRKRGAAGETPAPRGPGVSPGADALGCNNGEQNSGVGFLGAPTSSLAREWDAHGSSPTASSLAFSFAMPTRTSALPGELVATGNHPETTGLGVSPEDPDTRAHKFSRFPVFLTPIFIALAFLGGTLQHMALVVLVVMAVWLEEAVQIGWRKWREQIMPLARYAGWGMIGLALSAPVWLPAADAFITTHKLGIHTGLHGRHEGIYPVGPLQPLFNFAAYPGQIFPSIFGRSDSLDLLKLFKSELFYVMYFGSLPVLIGFMAAWKKRVPLIAKILVISGLLLPLTPLVRLLYQRLYLLFIIGGIYAFVHWMQHANNDAKRRLLKWATGLTTVATGCWLLASMVMQWQRSRLEEAIHGRIAGMGDGSSFGFFSDWMHGRTDKFIADLFIWSPHHLLPLALWLMILAGLWISLPMRDCGRDARPTWLGRLARSLPPRTGHAIIGVAVVLEVMLFASKWIVWTDPAKHPLFPETAESAILREHVGRDGRTTTLIHPTHHMARTPFVPNTLAAYGISTIRGYDSIVPDGINLVAMQGADPQALGNVGVTHLITWPGNPDVPQGWVETASTPSMQLYQNPFAVPRYAGIPIDESEPWIALRETTGLENRREIEVPAGLASLRIAENHGAGWQYRLDEGAWTGVARADNGSMTIRLATSSAATLELRYHPPLRRAGFALAGLAGIAWFTVAAITGRRLHPQ